ncbi:MAG TPA: hypothetical protein VGK64_24265 [Bryobacteraceae bacterium]
MERNRIRWLAWWYLAIAVGFVLLAIDHMIIRDKAWLIGIRLILAAGFGLLSRMEFTKRRQ